jgi:DNA-binding transcriptional LysR family regulator
MELRHLRYFVAVAETLHFGRAAARLSISQPSLSQQIGRLEADLQATLLHRTRRRVELSEAGRSLLPEARAILAHADRAAVLARRAGGGVGALRVSFAYWMDSSAIVSALASLHRRRGAVHLDVRTLPVLDQLAALRERAVDAAFVRPPVVEQALACETLFGERFVAALPARHRLAAGRGPLPVSSLAHEAFVVTPRSQLPVFYDAVLDFCRAAGFVPHVAHEAQHPSMVLALVAAGLGVSLVPAWSARKPPPAIRVRRLRPSPPALLTAVAWRRDDPSPILGDFLVAVRQMAGERRRTLSSAR